MRTFGGEHPTQQKVDNSNVVTEADLRSESIIVQGIRERFPDHSIIAEERGCEYRESEFTWVIDPLDGTSNYAAGIPWFGVLICVLRGKIPAVEAPRRPVAM